MSERMVIKGGNELYGQIKIDGMKNAALPILFACILIRDEVLLQNIPPVSDIQTTLRILKTMGATVQQISPTVVAINASNLTPSPVPKDLVGQLRGSSYLLGAELGRFGEAHLGIPGGCDFGKRPLDLHFSALESLGAEISSSDGNIVATTSRRLHGATVRFGFASVGATANVLLASVLADGITVIENAAREPHILDLCHFLNAAGAKISGGGTSHITVCGVPRLHGCHYRILPDMIEAGTYLATVAGTGGEVTLTNVNPSHLKSMIDLLRSMGATVCEEGDSVTLCNRKRLHSAIVKTAPYPGFPTDMHPQFGALFCAATTGVSSLRETVWGDRFRYLGELEKMGAEVLTAGRTALFFGGKLHGASVRATDLRGGAALLLAGLCADGTTQLHDTELLLRGYRNPTEKLRSLGADIQET